MIRLFVASSFRGTGGFWPPVEEIVRISRSRRGERRESWTDCEAVTHYCLECGCTLCFFNLTRNSASILNLNWLECDLVEFGFYFFDLFG
jgi:hypothetical protein